MKKNYTLTQKAFFTLLLAFAAISLNAQVSTYTYSQTIATYTPITGGTLLGNATSDDQRFVDPVVPLGGTATTGVGFPIGFNFTFNGIVFDRLAINNNGWISLGQSTLTPSTDNASSSPYVVLASTATNTPALLRNRIAGLARDLQSLAGASLRIETTGTTPNQVCVIQWENYKRFGSTGTGDTLNFQIRLYETTNIVEVHFSSLVFGTTDNIGTSSAPQIGLGGTLSTDFNSRFTTTDWNATTSATVNNQGCDVNTGVVVYPVNETVFIWTPPVVCAGTPIAGITESNLNPVCDGQTFILSLNGNSTDGGITYQWISSNDGINFVDVGGATSSTFSASQSATTYSRAIVTCTASGLSDTSVVLQVTMKPANLCYCNSAASNPADTKIDSVEFTTVLTGSSAATCETYTDYTSMVATIQQTVPFSLRIRNGSCSGTHYPAFVTVYIDYNQDGDLTDAGELVYSFGPTTALNTVPDANIAIPLSATLGQTGMRIIITEGALSGACDAYTYGETEDYLIDIAAAPICVNPPVSGSISGASATCPGNTILLNLSGHSVGTTLQWETSTDNSSWSDIAGETNTTYTTPAITDTVYYRVKVTCIDSVYTTAFEITLSPFTNCYCSSGIGGFCSSSEIHNVNIPTTLLNNNSGCNAVGADAYTFFPDTGVATATLYQTGTYQLNVNCSEASIISVWIDYNQNGVYEASEWTQVAINAQNASVVITIPLTAAFGQTGMRIRTRLVGNQNDSTSACLNFGSGETEDYIVTIVSAPTCTNPPVSGSITGSNEACQGTTPILALSGETPGTSLQWETSTDGSSWTELAGETNGFYTTDSITDTVYYRVRVICIDTVYTPAFEITLSDYVNCYCASEAASPLDTKIDSVQFLTVATGSLAATCETYTDYTSLVAAVQQTVPFALRIRNGSCSGIHYDAFVGVYIDYNHDADFDDAGETVYTFGPTTGLNTIPNGIITVPNTSQLGQTRMRIIFSEGALTGGCDPYTFGETEDYTLDVTGPPPCADPAIGGTATGPATGGVGPTYLYVVTGSNGAIQWQYSTTSATGPYIDIAGTNDDSLLVNFNGAATFWVRAYLTSPGCDPDSSNAVETLVTLAGDEVCDAVTLTFGTNGPFNTSFATIQTGEPGPPGIDCEVQDGWCLDSAITNTLWFAFIAPASGRVSIQSPGFDTQLALWDADNCDTILNGGATLIAANDDDPNSAAHGGASFSSYIDSAVCLTPGRTYYVQVDPYTSPGNSTTIVLTDLGGPVVSLNTETDISCFGLTDGAIDMDVTGGSGSYTYEWSSGELTEDVSGLGAGTYTLTVMEAGCEASAVSNAIVIDEPTPITPALDSLVNVKCFGESTGGLYVTISGGTPPYTYLWSNGSTDPNLVNVPAGLYSGVVTDANGCVFTSPTFPISEPASALAVQLDSVTDNLCFGGTAGAVYITASGGTAGYTYDWGGGVTNEDNTGLAAGVYDVTVQDANSCSVTTTGTVIEGAEIIAVLDSSSNVTCNGLSDGSIYITATGGVPAYSFDWSNNAITEDVTGLGSGSYDVDITDANGCTATIQGIVITEPNALVVTLDSSDNVTCNGANDGSVSISVEGGTPAYSFDWSNNAIDEDVTGLDGGSYTVDVTDANGCTATLAAVTVTEPTALVVTLDSTTNVACFGGSTGCIYITVSGGTPAYVYLWSHSATTGDICSLAAGNYSLTVSDANACTATFTGSVTQPIAALSATSAATDQIQGGTFGSINVTVAGGTSPYTPSWSNNAVTEDLSNLAAGIYTCTITDANGCTITLSDTVELITGIGNVTNTFAVNLYPNPTQNQVFLELTLNNASDVGVKVYNVTGQLISQFAERNILSTKFELNFANEASGVYYAKIKAGDTTLTRRIVVTK